MPKKKKKKVQTIKIKAKNGRLALSSKCVVCGRFMKKQEAE